MAKREHRVGGRQQGRSLLNLTTLNEGKFGGHQIIIGSTGPDTPPTFSYVDPADGQTKPCVVKGHKLYTQEGLELGSYTTAPGEKPQQKALTSAKTQRDMITQGVLRSLRSKK